MSESDSSWFLQGQDRSELVPLILWSLSFFFLQHPKRIILNSPRSLIVRVLVPVMIVMMYSRDRAWMARPLMSQVSFVVCSCHRKFFACVTDDKTKLLAPAVVQKVGSAIHWINLFPLGSAIGFRNTYPVDSAIQLLNNWDLDIKASCEPALESCSGPTRVYQVLSMRHDWPVLKSHWYRLASKVNLQVRNYKKE